MEKKTIVKGQVFEIKGHGVVKFEGLDYFGGQVTAKLTGVSFRGTTYPFLSDMTKNGFEFVDK